MGIPKNITNNTGKKIAVVEEKKKKNWTKSLSPKK